LAQLRQDHTREHAAEAGEDEHGHIGGVVDGLELAGAVAHFDVADRGDVGASSAAATVAGTLPDATTAEAPGNAGHGDDRHTVSLHGISEDLACVGAGLDSRGEALDETVAHEGDDIAARCSLFAVRCSLI